jgi:hypothetical protein
MLAAHTAAAAGLPALALLLRCGFRERDRADAGRIQQQQAASMVLTCAGTACAASVA